MTENKLKQQLEHQSETKITAAVAKTIAENTIVNIYNQSY